MPTFEEAAAAVLEQKRGGWRNDKHGKDWPTSLRLYAFPQIGDKPVSETTSADLLQVLAPIWHAKPETARRVRQRIGAVMKWAVAMEHRADNPAGEALGEALGRQQDVVRHMPALPHPEVAAAVEAVRASRAWVGTKLAFEYLVLTAARSAEVRLATWDEIDVTTAVWTVPGCRMKAKRPHRVPLSERALELVEEARALRGDAATPGSALVFPEPATEAPLEHDAVEAGPGARHQRRAARFPVVVPRLGLRADEPPARGGRGGARARRWEQGGGSLREVGPVRSPASTHGRVGGVSRRLSEASRGGP